MLEQNYEYDLINSDKVLQKSINEQISISNTDGKTVHGKLLSASGGNIMILDQSDNLQIIPRNDKQTIFLADYSGRDDPFILKPTLVWKLDSQKSGKEKLNISYLSRGLSWRADYVGKLNEKNSKIKLSAWITLENKSGREYKDSRLKLMAGDLHRATRRRADRGTFPVATSVRKMESVSEKAFFEYHLYTVPGVTTIKNNSIKQIRLFNTVEADIEKNYRINSYKADQVDVLVKLNNSKKNKLGIPLPKGIIRLYQADGKDTEFIGEDNIKHTAKDEKIEITVGKAFDIVSEREQLKTSQPSKRSRKYTIQYKIRNHKEIDVVVEVIEWLKSYQQNELLKSDIKYTEKTAKKIVFRVAVEAGKEKTFKFELLTSW